MEERKHSGKTSLMLEPEASHRKSRKRALEGDVCKGARASVPQGAGRRGVGGEESLGVRTVPEDSSRRLGCGLLCHPGQVVTGALGTGSKQGLLHLWVPAQPLCSQQSWD